MHAGPLACDAVVCPGVSRHLNSTFNNQTRACSHYFSTTTLPFPRLQKGSRRGETFDFAHPHEVLKINEGALASCFSWSCCRKGGWGGLCGVNIPFSSRYSVQLTKKK